MNTFISVCNLCRAAETLVFNKGKQNERTVAKLRLADNTYGDNETRFFDAIVSGNDMDVAMQLAQGDQIVIAGTLNAGSYKAKKGKMKGKTVHTDSMPFAKILQVTKSPTFFAKSGEDEEADEGSTEEPDLTEGSDAESTDEDIAEGDANPLADLENA